MKVKNAALKTEWIPREEVVILRRGSKGWLQELAGEMVPGGPVLRMTFDNKQAAKSAQSWLWNWGRKSQIKVSASLARTPDGQMWFVYAEVWE